MADYVRGRFHAARVGVTMALLGLLAGLGIKNEGGPPTTIVADPAAAQLLKKNSVGSAQIRNHSLLFTDLKIHQVPSYKEYSKFTNATYGKFLKLDAAAQGFLKITDANSTFIKLTDADSRFLKLDDANANFLHKADTAANALKI